jgi:predicted RecA/RadA family phage recombinase
MATAHYMQKGDILTLTAPIDTPVYYGRPLTIGNLFVIPIADAAPTEKFAGSLTQCWQLEKADAQEETLQGRSAYWRLKAPGIKEGVTSEATYEKDGEAIENKRIGDFIESSSQGVKEVGVRLNGSF